jgi:hypothetical protein
MTKRLLASFALTASALVTTVALGTASAQAVGYPGYVKYGAYNWREQCNEISNSGLAQHKWRFSYCDEVSPSNANTPGLYFLWVAY